MLKVYVLTRRDLTKPQQVVQTAHSVAGMVGNYISDKQVQNWLDFDKTLVILGVEDEKELEVWENKLKEANLRFYTFTESYYNNSKTSICVEPVEDGKMFKGLKLL